MTPKDLKLWMPLKAEEDGVISVDTAEYIIYHVSSIFCEMTKQEESAILWMKPEGMLVC